MKQKRDVEIMQKVQRGNQSDAYSYCMEREGSAWRISVLDGSYRIRFYNNKDKVAKGYYVDIKRKTGKAEMVFPVEHVADGTFQSHMDAVLDPLTKTFYGICSKIENKKL